VETLQNGNVTSDNPDLSFPFVGDMAKKRWVHGGVRSGFEGSLDDDGRNGRLCEQSTQPNSMAKRRSDCTRGLGVDSKCRVITRFRLVANKRPKAKIYSHQADA